ncbi:signal peptidase I [SAR202 cluster bacterium AD-802-E10_MRT_200m]|nr:signal peptidase I [SAR202 cluster bacterium AD-802-E10_MRT_200m]
MEWSLNFHNYHHGYRLMREFFNEALETLLAALIIFLLVQASFQNYRVFGESMAPTLENGQHLVVNKLIYAGIHWEQLGKFIPGWSPEPGSFTQIFHPPRRGEVVVFHIPNSPERDLVKRVIGVPGDVIQIENNIVYVNYEQQIEPYSRFNTASNLEPIKVPAESYFVMGDNRPQSLDSRNWHFTFIPKDHISGRVWFVYWPIGWINEHLSFLPGISSS